MAAIPTTLSDIALSRHPELFILACLIDELEVRGMDGLKESMANRASKAHALLQHRQFVLPQTAPSYEFFARVLDEADWDSIRIELQRRRE